MVLLNKLLDVQVRKHLGNSEELRGPFASLLKEISITYDSCEEHNTPTDHDENADAREVEARNHKLRTEADELKKAHHELGRILTSVNHGFFSRDMTTNRYTYLSPGCEKIYGYTVNEFFENNLLWYEVIYPDDKATLELDEERLNNQEEVLAQYRIIHKDKSIRWLELKIIPNFKDGKLKRIDGVVSDITARKKVEAERELIIKELMKSNADLKQFSFITSHNLRAPLSNISAILNLVDYSQLEPHNLEMLEMLKVSSQQLSKTIDDLTKIILIKNSVNIELSCVNIEELFAEVLLTFTNALNEVEGKYQTRFSAALIYHNTVYLESIFVNLISNAIRHRSPERSLKIEVETEDKNGSVTLRFKDNGIGIDLERHKDAVFGLYQRFHNSVEGQGLGLFMMKSQIEATGGKINVESEPGKGTTFIITFQSQPTRL